MIRVLFSYGEDEHLPILIGYGHNLKKDNLTIGEVMDLESGDNTQNCIIKTKYKKNDTNIYLSFANNMVSNMYMTINNKKNDIIDYKRYVSLQIGEYCYDNIHAFRIPENISYE